MRMKIAKKMIITESFIMILVVMFYYKSFQFQFKSIYLFIIFNYKMSNEIDEEKNLLKNEDNNNQQQ